MKEEQNKDKSIDEPKGEVSPTHSPSKELQASIEHFRKGNETSESEETIPAQARQVKAKSYIQPHWN